MIFKIEICEECTDNKRTEYVEGESSSIVFNKILKQMKDNNIIIYSTNMEAFNCTISYAAEGWGYYAMNISELHASMLVEDFNSEDSLF